MMYRAKITSILDWVLEVYGKDTYILSDKYNKYIDVKSEGEAIRLEVLNTEALKLELKKREFLKLYKKQ